MAWYKAHGRANLPWRTTRNPYYTLVSEFMLQQTQVDRVLPKFAEFVERLPTFDTLASAGTADVLRLWKGLGYNSRALRLKQIADAVVQRYGGKLPSEIADLRALPGIGDYTAAAIRAFAFDCDDAAIDTNVRRVAHRVLHGVEYPPKVSASMLDADARDLVPKGLGHDWNSAMMDLGASICTARAPKCSICPLNKICKAAPLEAVVLDALRKKHRRRRSPQEAIQFEKSTRFARGRIVDRLRELAPGQMISLLDLHRDIAPRVCDRTPGEIAGISRTLERDGLVRVQDGRFALAD